MTPSTHIPSLARRARSLRSGALLFSFGLVSLAGFAAQACGSSSGGVGTRPGAGAAASAGTGEGGEQASGGSAGSRAGSGKGGSGIVATGGAAASGGARATGGTTASGGSAGVLGDAGSGTTGSNAACDNGEDDDGDGLADGLDPECTGPFDQDEGSFATGIPGDNKDPKWQDCFFDGNSGGGDDGCRYPTTCLLGDRAADDPDCEIAQGCIDYCARLTPNGCDCFGCCTVQANDGVSVDIFTTATCSLDKLGDEAACPRCQKSIGCDNPCGECELCPGKTVADLPATCVPPPSTGEGGNGGAPDGAGGSWSSGGTPSTGGYDGGVPPPPSYTCDGGEQVCGPDLARCGTGLYCTLGCCMPIVR